MKDNTAPTPYCHSVSSALLSGVNLDVELWACDFAIMGLDNCTSDENMRYTFTSISPNDDPDYMPSMNCSKRVFSCDDVTEEGNPVKVDIYSWDEHDNFDHCTVELTLAGNCVPWETCCLSLGGNVSTHCGGSINDVVVTITSNQPEYPLNAACESNGYYYSQHHDSPCSYHLVVRSPSDYLNGVSTLDRVIIEKHLDGSQPFTSLYETIAADINNDGIVSSSDVEELDKLLLGQTDAYSNNTSWKFFDTRTLDTNDLNTFSQEIVLNAPNQDYADLDWIGIKVGDLNCSAEVISGLSEQHQESRFTVTQNWPNPVLDQSVIHFSIPYKGLVTIVLYSINGQQLLNHTSDYGDGEHHYVFDSELTAQLSSGTYFYTVKFADQTISNKLVKGQ